MCARDRFGFMASVASGRRNLDEDEDLEGNML